MKSSRRRPSQIANANIPLEPLDAARAFLLVEVDDGLVSVWER